MSSIGKLYGMWVELGRKDYASVSPKYIDEVDEYLRSEVVAGKISAERFEELTGKPYEEE